ncbi:unnamed protein product [Dimorphilus gyrociliatus]|uniref:Uncharacterized protein n=1 Tax=Dimorphilus gyrociliatus TaxID=2664684 RepID=A0A7I8VMW1_9ANNE|nr:unnamed protein product [Dimorphilus gyrociliatus]
MGNNESTLLYANYAICQTIRNCLNMQKHSRKIVSFSTDDDSDEDTNKIAREEDHEEEARRLIDPHRLRMRPVEQSIIGRKPAIRRKEPHVGPKPSLKNAKLYRILGEETFTTSRLLHASALRNDESETETAKDSVNRSLLPKFFSKSKPVKQEVHQWEVDVQLADDNQETREEYDECESNLMQDISSELAIIRIQNGKFVASLDMRKIPKGYITLELREIFRIDILLGKNSESTDQHTVTRRRPFAFFLLPNYIDMQTVGFALKDEKEVLIIFGYLFNALLDTGPKETQSVFSHFFNTDSPKARRKKLKADETTHEVQSDLDFVVRRQKMC